MKRTYLVLSIALLFALTWGCSQDSSMPTESSVDLNSQSLQAHSTSPQSNAKKMHAVAQYEITLENLTPATGAGASQPLSPPVFATHAPSFRLFHLDGYASDELRQVAEDAVNDPLVTRLESSERVFETTTGDAVILPGDMATYTIDAKIGFHKLTLVSMLVNTNDGFTGVNKLNLQRQGSKTFYLRAFDAGTEENTELESDIPGPCCGSHGVRVPTHQRIRFHQGILGVGDLHPAVYDWDGPVAKLTVTRIN